MKRGRLNKLPLISCVMPTYGRPNYVDEAVGMFVQQDYPAKELVILNDCPGQVFHSDRADVRVINYDTRFPTLGEKRNVSIEIAQGELLPFGTTMTRTCLGAYPFRIRSYNGCGHHSIARNIS